MHAVDPERVANLPQFTAPEIVQRVNDLPGHARWVVLSGGNPGLFLLDELVGLLHDNGYLLMMETQGTIGHPWVQRINDLTVSPKPPSSGNMTTVPTLLDFFRQCEFDQWAHNDISLKIVVFDEQDYQYARAIRNNLYLPLPMFLSVGNPAVGKDVPQHFLENNLLARLRWLCERVLHDEDMRDVRVLPQMHVLIWGNKLGV